MCRERGNSINAFWGRQWGYRGERATQTGRQLMSKQDPQMSREIREVAG